MNINIKMLDLITVLLFIGLLVSGNNSIYGSLLVIALFGIIAREVIGLVRSGK